jgi:hypothetical protein
VIVVTVVTLFFLRRRQKATLTSDEDTPEGRLEFVNDTVGEEVLTTYSDTVTCEGGLTTPFSSRRYPLSESLLDSDFL